MNKYKAKKFLVLLAVLLVVFLACGCSPFNSQVDDLLRAPKLTGEMQPVQEALEKSISSNHTLVYPAYGEYRTAITMADLDLDGVKEAIALYSTSVDNTVYMNVAVVDKTDGKWAVSASQSIVAGDVERFMLKDLDGDGRQEILIGFNVYGTVDKTLCVYEYTGSSMITILDTPYTAFITCDLNDDFSNDLLVLSLNTTAKTGSASYYSVTSDAIREIGTCMLDGAVTGYYDPIVTKLSSGKFCVYVDAAKGAGLITEIIYFEDGELVNALYNQESTLPVATQRSSIITCRDFDGDSIVEIPIMKALPIEAQFSVNEQAYLTTWCSYSGSEFVEKKYTLVNYNDGYYIELTKEQTEFITVVRDSENRERAVYAYDYENESFGKILFSVRAVTKASYDQGSFESGGFIKLGENDTLVYLLTVYEAAGEYGFNKNMIKDAFSLIKEE